MVKHFMPKKRYGKLFILSKKSWHNHSKTGNANDAQMDALRVTLQNFKRKHMIYFEHNQPHYFVWPCLALGLDDEFWIGIGWLNFEIGWRNGDGGWGNEAKLRSKNT